MGVGRYLRRSIAQPIADRLDAHNQLRCELDLRRLLECSPYTAPGRLEAHGFRSFSQNDEDGIVQEIFKRIGTESRTFVEFGVEDGLENNSRLLLYQGWRGLWIEGDVASSTKLHKFFAPEIASQQLQICTQYVTSENINDLIGAARLDTLDLLSIDVDGNDYWIWQAVTARPRLVIVEYNAKFRPPTRWVMNYNPTHRWAADDYHGASLQSLTDLAATKGYKLVGCGLAGANAFFVREDLVEDRFALSDPAALYNPPRYYLHSMMSRGHPAGPFGPYRLI